MRRLHLFEFGDQAWLPRRLRDYLLEFLQYQITSARLYDPVTAKLKEALEASGCRHLVDVGSGGGETILRVREKLREAGCPVSLTLTDKYPNADAVRRINDLADEGVAYWPEPVDALEMPPGLEGFRVFFTSFHHLRPASAAAVLRRAVEARAPVGVFEFTARSLPNLAGMLLSPLAVLALMRKTRPRTFGKLFWTYALPVVPLLYWWDGTVSHCRTYGVAELEDLIAGLGENSFRWEVGRLGGGPEPVTYLVGLPR